MQGFAQSELDAFNKKDVIEKMDRSDLDMESKDNVKIDESILKFEIPKIEFDVPVKKPVRATKNTTSKAKKVVKKPPSKKVVTIPFETTPVKTPVVKKDKTEVVFVRRPISINQMKKNDKIAFTDGITYVYRIQKSNVIQFKFNGKIPFDSKGLRKNDETSYYIVDKTRLIADYRKLRSNSKKSISKPKVAAVKPPSKTKPLVKKPTVIKKDTILDDQVMPVDVSEKRKAIEKKFNNGRVIKKSIQLKSLRENDEIYIVGDIQFVFRKISSNSVKKKYWLTEKLDINNKAVKKVGNNKYEIIRFYKTD